MRKPRTKRYTFLHFVVDATLTLLTHGIWFIWIVVRTFR